MKTVKKNNLVMLKKPTKNETVGEYLQHILDVDDETVQNMLNQEISALVLGYSIQNKEDPTIRDNRIHLYYDNYLEAVGICEIIKIKIMEDD